MINIDTQSPHFGINMALIGGMALTSAAFLILVIGFLLRSRHKPIVSGEEELIHSEGVAIESFKRKGLIKVHSENWLARTDNEIKKDQKVKVIGIEGLILIVKPL